jgi:hypothetical protein
MERELGETIKIIFMLQAHEAGDMIVAQLDVVKKIDLVWAATQVATKDDGSETPKEWKARAEKTMKDILRCNNPDRVLLAHAYLEPGSDGSVDFARRRVAGGELKGEDLKPWSAGDFASKIQELVKLTKELESVKSELQTFRINLRLMRRGQPIHLAVTPFVSAVRISYYPEAPDTPNAC